MATVTIQRKPPVEQPIESVTLVLNEAEAEAVYAIINGEGEVGTLRLDHVVVYDVLEALENAFELGG